MSLVLIALLQLSLFFHDVISTCSTNSDLEFTFYGCPDGPSDTTSFGCSGTAQVQDGTAGGVGTYSNPETFATALNNPNFVPCEIIYIPLLRKYFQYMDHCEECMDLYPGTIRIDLWIGTDVNGGTAQITCEDDFGLKPGQTIVRDPPSTLQVNSAQLWDNDSQTCNDDTMVFPGYSTDEAEMCDGSSTTSSGGDSSSGASTFTFATSTPSTASDPTLSVKEMVTLATFVSATPSLFTTSSTSDCGVTAEWPTAWLGHCVGTPCHDFNDCSGELICKGWPFPVCGK